MSVPSVPVSDVACYYINLDERTDRRAQVEAELSVFQGQNVHREPGTKHTNGHYGLVLSALRVLDSADQQEHDVCCVFEDDFQWELPTEEVRQYLIAHRDTIRQGKANMILLCYHIPLVHLSELEPPLARVSNGQMGCAYMFHKSFIPEIRKVFASSRDNLLTGNPDVWALDQTWKALQTKEHRTYAAIPRLGQQRPSHSDIVNTSVSYGGGLFMVVLSCKKYEERRLLQDLSRCPFPYRYFIGDPSIAAPREEGNVVYLPCGDGYEFLPRKTYLALDYMNKRYPRLDWAFKTDDDIVIDFEKLYAMYTQLYLRRIRYAGRGVQCKPHVSTYHYGKCTFPSTEVPFYVEEGAYCSGGGYFLSREALTVCLASKDVYWSHVFEDMATGKALQRGGVHPVHVPIQGEICKW